MAWWRKKSEILILSLCGCGCGWSLVYVCVCTVEMFLQCGCVVDVVCLAKLKREVFTRVKVLEKLDKCKKGRGDRTANISAQLENLLFQKKKKTTQDMGLADKGAERKQV